MSWDVLLIKAPVEVADVEGFTEDFRPEAIGSLSEALGRLEERVLGVDLSDPSWGHLTSEAWSIELNIGSDDPLESVMLHVRGSGDDVVPVVLAIADVLGCRALDVSSGEFLHEGETTGWRAFQKYRDRVTGRPGT